ncbi:hypothetical protein ACILDT_07905 [Capnocytophaga canis]|uniref:hypothetical protein n=1 Tax=Capnocytophaga canis TaxID=1848903 RepID=UPI0037CFE69F
MKFIVNRLLVPKGYSRITLFPFVFVSKKECLNDPQFLNHEKIHLQQQKELLVVFFYLWYVLDFLFKYIKYRNWQKAYHNIIFEREAYHNQDNLNYLNSRKRFAFLKKDI